MTRLILIRHGETGWNKKGKKQGREDIELSKTGLKQAKLLARRLAKEKIDYIFSSPLKRALKTAEEIAKYHKLNVIKNKRLMEINYGVFSGLTNNDIKKRFHLSWKIKDIDSYNFKPPKGESRKELEKRVMPFIRNLIKSNKNRTLAIISHNGVTRTIIGNLLGWKKEKIFSINLSNTSINILEINEKKAKLKLFDYDKHL